MISGCGAGCAHRRGEQRGDVTGRQRRARGALDRHAAGAGAELAKGHKRVARSNGAGGSGDVGRKGDRSRAVARGVRIAEASSEVMSRGDRGAQRRASSARGVSRRRAGKGARRVDAQQWRGRQRRRRQERST